MTRKRTSLPTTAALVLDAQASGTVAALQPAQVNREQWLQNAVKALRPVFAEAGIDLPEVHVSCGFPKGNVKKVIGQCWTTGASEDGKAHLFITPFLNDSVRVLDVLVHELIHAVDDCQSGHKGEFVRMAKALGLEGKPTATVAGETLRATLEGLVEVLGAYPHSALSDAVSPVKKQTTRMLKVECPEDGYTIRTTAKWLAVGVPTCPCGTQMVADVPAEDPDGDED